MNRSILLGVGFIGIMLVADSALADCGAVGAQQCFPDGFVHECGSDGEWVNRTIPCTPPGAGSQEESTTEGGSGDGVSDQGKDE